MHTQYGTCPELTTVIVTVSLLQLCKGNEPRERASSIQFVKCMSRWAPVYRPGHDRLKEAANSNRSVGTFGRVISALADKSRGLGRNIIVPYRDSALTRLMQQSLGGNCNTSMLVTLSAGINSYDETLSSLRYAHQTSMIVNRPQTIERDLMVLRRQYAQQLAAVEE